MSRDSKEVTKQLRGKACIHDGWANVQVRHKISFQVDDNTHHGHFMEQLIRKFVMKKATLYVVLNIMEDLITDQNSKLMLICPL